MIFPSFCVPICMPKRTPKKSDSASAISKLGLLLPFSYIEMALFDVPIRSASSCCVRPFSFLNSLILFSNISLPPRI